MLKAGFILLSVTVLLLLFQIRLSAEPKSTTYEVVKGFTERDGIKYPVYHGIDSIFMYDMTRGMQYDITRGALTRKNIGAHFEKVKKFYAGNTINNVKIPAFKKHPQHNFYYAFNANKGKKTGTFVLLKYDDSEDILSIYIHMIPNISEKEALDLFTM